MATGGGHPGAGSVTQVTAGRTELDVSLQQPSATQQMLDTFWPTHTEKINNIDIVCHFGYLSILTWFTFQCYFCYTFPHLQCHRQVQIKLQ